MVAQGRPWMASQVGRWLPAFTVTFLAEPEGPPSNASGGVRMGGRSPFVMHGVQVCALVIVIGGVLCIRSSCAVCDASSKRQRQGLGESRRWPVNLPPHEALAAAVVADR